MDCHINAFHSYLPFFLLGFFGELLTLVCQTFTMSDLVMLLHGQHQPLSRIQPQLAQFFTQNYLNGREPTDHNIAVSTPRRPPGCPPQCVAQTQKATGANKFTLHSGPRYCGK